MLETDIFVWAFVGLASGAVLGLAGAGGNLIAIPILMTFGGYDVKEASGYALLSLTVGASIAWFLQRKNTNYPITAVLIVFACMVAFLSASLKTISPPWLVSVLLNLTCLFSLYSLWVLPKPEDSGENRPLAYQLTTASVGGIMIGFLSTMTGLGGGVVIIPWLTGITRLKFEQAMACSLLTIAVTAPISAWQQNALILEWHEWAVLCGMTLVASLIVKKAMTYFSVHLVVIARKSALTGVILIAMLKTLVELF